MNLRFIPYSQYPATLNMALDMVLLDKSVESGEHILRFYGFKPASVTLGKFQGRIPPGLAAYPAARRPTGGRAVLHDGDLVFCLAGPATDGFFAGAVLETYRKTAEILRDAARSLGVEVELETGKPQPYQEMCFESTSRYELTLSGRKVVGIAQFRDRGFFLEQGSIYLPVDHEQFIEQVKAVFAEKGFSLAERCFSPEEMQVARLAQKEFEIT